MVFSLQIVVNILGELHLVVNPEAFDGVIDVVQEFGRRPGIWSLPRPRRRSFALEGVDLSHARRVILEQDQVQNPPSKIDCPGDGKINENAL